VRVGVANVVNVQCGFDYRPSSALNAQMSLRYVVAAALVEGQALPPQFTDEKIAEPRLVELAQSIELVPDPKLDALYPKEFPGWVAAESRGEWVRADVANPTGSKYVPIDARGITEKFRGINPALPTDRIAEVALHIESHSVRKLLALLARAN
jgi:2-methylcitrate dehydratase PrpD